MDLFLKAFYILKRRPLHFIATVGDYFRFQRTKFLSRFLLTPAQGIFLGDNVRLQAIKALNAERPDARVEIGADSIIYEKALIEAYGKGRITIGEGTIIGEARICSRGSITLGRRVVTSWNVFIQDFDPHPTQPELRALQMRHMVENFQPRYRARREVPVLGWEFTPSPIVLGDDVWIGANCTILKGVTIGSGSIVATGSIVTAGNYPERSILAGAPARVIKTLTSTPTPSS